MVTEYVKIVQNYLDFVFKRLALIHALTHLTHLISVSVYSKWTPPQKKICISLHCLIYPLISDHCSLGRGRIKLQWHFQGCREGPLDWESGTLHCVFSIVLHILCNFGSDTSQKTSIVKWELWTRVSCSTITYL